MQVAVKRVLHALEDFRGSLGSDTALLLLGTLPTGYPTAPHPVSAAAAGKG